MAPNMEQRADTAEPALSDSRDDAPQSTSGLSEPLSDVVLTSDIWGTLPTDVLGEIAAQLPTLSDLERTSIIRLSEICRLWREVLSHHLFHEIKLVTYRDESLDSTLGSDEHWTDTEDDDSWMLRRFLRFLDETKSSGRSIVKYIKCLLITDRAMCRIPFCLYYATWLDPAALRVNLNAKLLVDILGHFRHLEQVTITSMLPVDGFRIAELMSQVQDSASDVGQPQAPTDVDELRILFWDTFDAVHNSIPRLIGLVSLFGKIASLTVNATLNFAENNTPDYITLPPLPSHTRISSMYLTGECSDPRIARALISPATTSDLTWLEVQVNDMYREDLRQTLLLPALDPQTLCLMISDPGSPDSPPLLDVAQRHDARLRVLILSIVVDKDRFYREVTREEHKFGDVNGLIKCLSKILSTLNAPGAAHSIQRVDVLLIGLALYWNVRGQSPELMGLCRELDTVLAGLHESVHGIETGVIPFEMDPFNPALKQTSDTLMTELFPCSKNSDSLFPIRINK